MSIKVIHNIIHLSVLPNIGILDEFWIPFSYAFILQYLAKPRYLIRMKKSTSHKLHNEIIQFQYQMAHDIKNWVLFAPLSARE